MMTDYKEEQKDEIEALESIYPESFTVISEDPWTFSIKIFSEEDDETETLDSSLQFTYTDSYPDEEPLFEIIDAEDKDDEFVVKLNAIITEQIQENIGTVMIFTIVSAVQEFLNESRDEIKEKIVEEKERKYREAKEEEERKCHGTPVTVASFMAWKLKFLEEMQQLEKQSSKDEKKSKKLTGKEIFMQKGTITDDSEVLDGEEAVDVDESLFEDLDDFDLDDDDDDLDYNPDVDS